MCNTPTALNKLTMMNLHWNQFSKRSSTEKPAEARAHTAYCALKEHTLTALTVAEDVTSAGLMLPNEREFMCCARQPPLRKWAAKNTGPSVPPLLGTLTDGADGCRHATSAGLMLPNECEFMCCARQPTRRKWAVNNSSLAYSPLVEFEFNTEIG